MIVSTDDESDGWSWSWGTGIDAHSLFDPIYILLISMMAVLGEYWPKV